MVEHIIKFIINSKEVKKDSERDIHNIKRNDF